MNPALPDVETVVQQLADEMVSALPVTVASVAIWEQPRYSLRVKAVSAARPLPVPPVVGARVPLASASLHRAAFDRQAPVFIQPSSGPSEMSDGCLSLIPDLQSVYLVPIRAGGETVGVVGLGEMRAPNREPFGQDKRRRCQEIIAGFLTSSAHAWEAGRLRRQVRAMSSLVSVAGRIQDASTYQDVLVCIGGEISDWLGFAVRGMIFRVERSGAVEVVARWRLQDDLVEADALQLLASVARAGGTRGFPLSVVSVSEDPLDPFHVTGIGTAWTRIVLPAMRRDRLLGLACLYVEEELWLADWELDALQRRAEMMSVGMDVVEARHAHRHEREWFGRAAWDLLTTHQRTAVREAIAGVERLVSARVSSRFNATELPMGDPASGRVIVDAVLREVHDLLAELRAGETAPGSDDGPSIPMEVNDLVRHVLDIVRVKSSDWQARQGIIASLECEPAEGPLVVEASIGLVGAILHAIENALEALPGGGQVRIRTAREDGLVVITISDTGRSLPESVRQAAFQPLFSTKGANRLGLGLSVVRAIVESHGGTVTLSSGETGTELALRLPLHRPSRSLSSG
jgi:signal transduction histidine kinase